MFLKKYFSYYCEEDFCNDEGIFTPPQCKSTKNTCALILAGYTSKIKIILTTIVKLKEHI